MAFFAMTRAHAILCSYWLARSGCGVFASAVDDGLDIVACHADPNSGNKTLIRRQNLKGQTEEIAE